jgi:predicted SnoaL-like aldol condensation-catalyzing enzyme
MDRRLKALAGGAMKTLTPSRLIAAAAVTVAALSFGVAHANTDRSGAPTRAGSKACVHGTALLERNKRNVVAYYTTAFNDKDPELAVSLYGGSQYIQHNPLAANGFAAFIAFVNSFTAAFPDAHIDIRRVVAECDLVVTHSLATGAVPVYGPLGSKVVDIFRLDENGKIVEHWDVLAQLSPTSANGNPEV